MGLLGSLFGGGNDGDDGKGNPLLNLLIKALTGDKGNTGDDKNPLAKLFTALISFLQELFNPTEKSAPPGYEDAPDPSLNRPSQPAETRAQMDARNKTEEQASKAKYDEPIWKKYNPATIVHVPHELDELRAASEKANGGQKVEAISPVADMGRVTSDFGEREAPTAGASTEHKGLDIAPKIPGTNDDVRAPMPGVVVFAGWKSGYGNTLDIMDIYGTTHRFGHLAEIDRTVGEQVNQGEKVAVMGMTGRATGVHLHYEQRDEHQVAYNPVINGRTYGNGDIIPEGNTALASLGTHHDAQKPAKSPIDEQLAKLGLSGSNITEAPLGYSAPTSGKGPLSIPPRTFG